MRQCRLFHCLPYTADKKLLNFVLVLAGQENAFGDATSWWRHQMETSSMLLVFRAGNAPVPGEFPAQRPVTRIFDVLSDLRRNKWLSKQSGCWWFETPSCSLWRHCKVHCGSDFGWLIVMLVYFMVFTWGRFWSSGDFVACVWLSVCVRQPRACSCDNSPVQHRWSSDAGISKLGHPKMADAFPRKQLRARISPCIGNSHLLHEPHNVRWKANVTYAKYPNYRSNCWQKLVLNKAQLKNSWKYLVMKTVLSPRIIRIYSYAPIPLFITINCRFIVHKSYVTC